MPLNLPAVLILEKNKIATANPWLVTLDITLVQGEKFYFVHNTEDIIFQSRNYTAFPFQIEIPKIGSKGELPVWTLRVSNVTRILQAYIEAQDGGVGAEIIVRFVNAGYLSENYADLETTLEVMSTKADVQWVTFTLGMPNPMHKRFPRYRYIADHCGWDFKGAECGYTGSAVVCKKNLENCRSFNNSGRFGGKPGMSNYAIRLA